MREIKFRAWDKKNKRMCRVGRIEWSIDDYFVVWIEWDEKDEHREELRNLSQVDIMQYTGLKDKYGKEIYEGDIIKIRTKKYDEDKGRDVWIEEIVWIKCHDLTDTKAYFDLEAKHCWDNGHSYEDYDDRWERNENIAVIGNIYENKELLENKEVK